MKKLTLLTLTLSLWLLATRTQAITVGTGQNNLFKYLAGLDPTNPASIFMVTSTQAAPPSGVAVTWTSVPGYGYQVLYGNNPNGPWQTIGGAVTAAVNQVSMTYTDTTASAVSSRFYRIQNLGQ